MLRLKALTGDAEPEVLGECFSALLAREPHASVAFVERFIGARVVDVGVEAVSALAAARDPASLAVVRRVWYGELALELRRAIVFACGASALPESADFLLAIAAETSSELAVAALTALGTSRFRGDAHDRARAVAAARDDAAINAAFERAFETAAR